MSFIAQGKTNVKYLSIIVIVAILAGIAVFLYGQGINKKLEMSSPSSTANSRTDNQIVGNDRDAHGCIGSAGYSWCEAKQTCIRSWEQYCTAAAPKAVLFNCSDSKTIAATFYPSDDKFVDLVLSDGRSLSVPRAISASGARFANSDETFVFWNKGDTAFITEGASSTQTFSNCVLEAD